MQLKEKIVVVTGASGGIGRALVSRFLAEGAARVVALDLKPFASSEDDRLVTMTLDVSNAAEMSGCSAAANDGGALFVTRLRL